MKPASASTSPIKTGSPARAPGSPARMPGSPVKPPGSPRKAVLEMAAQYESPKAKDPAELTLAERSSYFYAYIIPYISTDVRSELKAGRL